MKKKLAVIFLALIVSISSLTACSDKTDGSSSVALNPDNQTETASLSNEKPETADNAMSENSKNAFADGDYKNVESEPADAQIKLSGKQGTISDTARGSSGSEVTITSKGIYHVSGESENVSIIINDSAKSGNIYLVLDNVNMKNDSQPCIIAQQCDKLIVQCAGKNSLEYSAEDNDSGLDGAVYSNDDITINGSGDLAVTSKQHGIVSKNDLKITGTSLNVTAAAIGLKAKDSIRIGGGEISVNSEHDGVQVENKSGDSYLHMEKGTLNIETEYDGIDVGTSGDLFSGYINLAGGTVNIKAGGGSENSADGENSQKGVKCDGDIYFENADINVSSADDAVHSGASVKASGSKLELSTSDDGITATDNLIISDGEITVSKSYEGLEATNIVIDGGKVNVTSSDDGINAGGGSDTASTEKGPWGSGSASGTLNINGGEVYINASGDGLDSNGSIYVTGGTVIVEGPTNDGNGAIDKGDSSECTASITGGTVIAIGSQGMAVNFDSGTQCSALVSLSGSAGDEISADDGSGFSFKATKSFECVVYSSPKLSQGSTYKLTAGSSSADMDFTSGLYYSNVESHGFGGMGGAPMGGGHMAPPDMR